MSSWFVDHLNGCVLPQLAAIKELGSIEDSLSLVRLKDPSKVAQTHADYLIECRNVVAMIRQLAIEVRPLIPIYLPQFDLKSLPLTYPSPLCLCAFNNSWWNVSHLLTSSITHLTLLPLHLPFHQPQNSVPDAIIWMLCDNKRVAYHRIPSHHLMYSTQPECRGRMCGRVQTFFLKVRGMQVCRCAEGSCVGRWSVILDRVWLHNTLAHKLRLSINIDP